jgi:hypothetical protein
MKTKKFRKGWGFTRQFERKPESSLLHQPEFDGMANEKLSAGSSQFRLTTVAG